MDREKYDVIVVGPVELIIPVGHSRGHPWSSQTAAATAANTASDPLTGTAVDGSTVTSRTRAYVLSSFTK